MIAELIETPSVVDFVLKQRRFFISLFGRIPTHMYISAELEAELVERLAQSFPFMQERRLFGCDITVLDDDDGCYIDFD